MPKYLRKPPLVPMQEMEIYPLMDGAMELPIGKALVYPCTPSRANYLVRIISGERYRNAISSIFTYSPGEPLYGKGLYYNLEVQAIPKGLLLAHVEAPLDSITWRIIQCAATKKAVPIAPYKYNRCLSRLNQLRLRNSELFIFIENDCFNWAAPSKEEMIVVDIDVKGETVPPPTAEQKVKARQ
jgi:hypothetical protein